MIQRDLLLQVGNINILSDKVKDSIWRHSEDNDPDPMYLDK